MKEVVIIGGGASGIACAISAARAGRDVTILERNSKCGKKLLITGNGRCNFWNDDHDLCHYHSSHNDLVSSFIDSDCVLDFFDSLGLVYKVKNGGYYPFSNQALSVESILESELRKLNVEVITDFKVYKIVKFDGYFLINDCVKAKNVVIACGSKACSKTGCDGSGYDLALSLGHRLIKPLPSLVQLKGNEDYFKKWSGIRADVEVKLYECDSLVKSECGEIQLTDYGLSGICIFNLSGLVAKGLDNNLKEAIRINFMPWTDDVYVFLKKIDKSSYRKNIGELLEGFLHYKLVDIILKKCLIKRNIYLNNLSKNEVERLTYCLSNFEVLIDEVNSFEHAQVCQGGIPLDEINPSTMESLIVKNLYFAGEIVDIDGDCGGYNLGFAWMSGIKAGKNVGI